MIAKAELRNPTYINDRTEIFHTIFPCAKREKAYKSKHLLDGFHLLLIIT